MEITQHSCPPGMRSLGTGQASEHFGCDYCKGGYSCREAETVTDMLINECADKEYCPDGYEKP